MSTDVMRLKKFMIHKYSKKSLIQFGEGAAVLIRCKLTTSINDLRCDGTRNHVMYGAEEELMNINNPRCNR